MWIACLSHPQNGVHTLPTEVDSLLHDALFARAVGQSKLLLMVPNSSESIFTRLWCCLEIKIAVDAEVPVEMARSSIEASTKSSRSNSLVLEPNTTELAKLCRSKTLIEPNTTHD